MPTPSSHGDNNSVNFNSTCPDEQAPRAPSSWLQPQPSSPLLYENDNRPLDDSASPDSSGGGSVAGIGRSEQQLADVEPAPTPASAWPLTTNNPPPVPETGSLFLNDDASHQGHDDDDANKQTDADENIIDTNTAGTTATTETTTTTTTTTTGEARNQRGDRIRLDADRREHSARSGSRRAGNLNVAQPRVRYTLPDMDPWESYGVNQALMRQYHESSNRIAAAADTPSPSSMDNERVEDQGGPADEIAWAADGPVLCDSYCDPTSLRVIPASPSTFLRPGSRFVGTQQSERQVYDVQVEIKHVDLRESFLCGYLRIQGLTEDHPTLTTYFEGEIIGSKYGFNTKHKSWGANDHTDMSHWAKFAAFRQFLKQAKKGNFMIKEHLQKENIFMRWKEHFLVPDHRVRTIHGASFEGFYYICFNQVEGVVHGIYFHSKSEKFQQLELKHVEDKGCMSAVEFR